MIRTFASARNPAHFEISHSELLAGVIGAADLFLIATVLHISGFGIYMLFVSKIDAACGSEAYSTLLGISSLKDLRNKIIKVIVMVLIVSFFQRVLELQINTSFDMLMMAASVLSICIGVCFPSQIKSLKVRILQFLDQESSSP